jgi:hypothetical protein
MADAREQSHIMSPGALGDVEGTSQVHPRTHMVASNSVVVTGLDRPGQASGRWASASFGELIIII